MDSGGNENIGVYVEAKAEYTRQFSQYLIPALLDFFLNNLFKGVQETDPKKLLWNFQNLLKDIPEWNIDKVKRETETIIQMTRCDYLEELLTAVFIAHTKVLSAIRLTSKQKKIQITIPKLDHFIHRVLGDCARILWSNVYLFNPTGSSVERQKNINQIETHLQEGVLQSIRNMLPVKSILKEYLHDDGDEEEEQEKPEVKETKEEEEKPKVEEEKIKEEEEKPKVEEEKVKEEEATLIVPPPTPILADPSPAPIVPELLPKEITPASEPEKEQPTIVIDTEPTVHFATFDTVFDPNDPAKNTISASPIKDEIDSDEDEDDELVKILDSGGDLKPEEDDYEEL